MGLLEGKTIAILGVANRFSIAWSIAQALHREGARLVFSYQGERVEKTVRQLAESLDSPDILPLDVQDDSQLDQFFRGIEQTGNGLHGVVHSIAFAPSEAISGTYLATTRDQFRVTLEISAYSLAAVTQRAAPLLIASGGGSVITLTYLGGERVVPYYNVMGVAKAALDMSVRYLAYDLGTQGVRVNAISAGPISTASSRAIKGATLMINRVAESAPYKRNTRTDEVADTAVYLLSDLSRGVTGEVIHVDAGFHAMGLA